MTSSLHLHRPVWRALSWLLLGILTAPIRGAVVDFVRDVEPILVKRCFECHGPDQQKASLRLDSRRAAILAGKSGKIAIVPGQPGDSEVLRRILSTDPDEFMPPKGARLTESETSALRSWIESGAEWPESDPRRHWAFVKPVQPEAPAVRDPDWSRSAIDRFVRARLDREGLPPQSEADRPTLLRRISLDLIGLPPTWAEVEEFVRDTDPNAYEKVVDRLLASPHYGENMAREWLDLARYADSNGYQVDLARSIWPYRDWVIRSHNDNQRFDQFTIEQIAGDLLADPTIDQKIATGFNRNTKVNDEGGGDAEEYRTKAVKDRVATLGTAWLGLTLACAECHTHKYDPISHDEYYQFYAFFNNTTDGGNYNNAPVIDVPAPDLTATESHLNLRLNEARSSLEEWHRTLEKEQSAWERTLAESARVWTPLKLANVFSTGGSSYTNLPDQSVLGTGVNPIYDTISMESETDLSEITAVMLEVLPDPSLPKNGPGRWGASGNFILDEFAMSAAPRSGVPTGDTNVFFSTAFADWEQTYYRAEHAVDRNPKTGWAIGPRFGQSHLLIAQPKNVVRHEGGSRLTFRFEHYHGNSHCIGRFRISVTREPDPGKWWPTEPELASLASVPTDARTDGQTEKLRLAHRRSVPRVRALEQEIHRLNEKVNRLAGKKFTTPVMEERKESERRKTHVHVRGNFLEAGNEVSPNVPSVLPSLPEGEKRDRLALAKWLVHPDHPLTARVAVNRYWQHYFGTGLVKTSEDFGRQGEAPSHPELLDWLATEFMRTGWDVKAMQKMIVMSRTYRQSAATDVLRQEKDFYNRLLSRGPRFRMDAELIRDHALAVSGRLNRQMGGPSVYPVQVPNLWKEIGFLRPEIGMDEWPESDGPDRYRRGVYTFWRRVCTYPTFATFDAPSREVCAARRPRTNTPMQALAAMNEPTLLEAALGFARRILDEGGSSEEQRIRFAFQTCLGRMPTARESERIQRFLESQYRSFRGDPDAAAQLIQSGMATVIPGTDRERLAAWMMVANLLFNLDETLTKG